MTKDEREYFDKKFGSQDKEIAEIKRGIYGDPVNKVKGLVDVCQDHHERISKIEFKWHKVVWIGGTVGAIIYGILKLIAN